MIENIKAKLTGKYLYWFLFLLAIVGLYFTFSLGFFSDDSSSSSKKEDVSVIEDISVTFTTGWSTDEKTHRWTTSDISKISLVNFTDEPKLAEITFSLNSSKKSNIKIIYNSKIIKSIDNLIPGIGTKGIKLFLTLKEGINYLEIKSSEKPVKVSKADKRMLGTMIMDFKAQSISTKKVNALFTSGWSIDEDTHRWTTSEKSEINFLNLTDDQKIIEATFSLNTLKASNVKIIYNSESIASFDLIPWEPLEDITLVFIAYEGDNYLEIISSEKPVRASKEDKRMLGTMLLDFSYFEKKPN